MRDERGPERRAIGVAVIGTGSVARAHIEALRALPSVAWPSAVEPRLQVLCSRRAERAAEGAERWGFARWTTDWRNAVEDGDVDLVVLTTPNDLHAEPAMAALAAGKHVLCEKPLARTADEALGMLEAAQHSGRVHATGFNYRFVPALHLAHSLIAEGRLGPIHHVRGVYLKGSGTDAASPIRWRHRREIAGHGTLGDLGSHVLDLARWLGGEIAAVNGITRTFVPERPAENGGMAPVTVDDAASATLEFAGGAIGILDVTRFAPGYRNWLGIEVNGARGTVRFNLERLNELEVYLDGDAPDVQGFRTVLVTEATHPYYRYWWPSGHIIGWQNTFVHQAQHLLLACAGLQTYAPDGATFEDGYRAVLVADSIVESARTGRRVRIVSQ
jgi:predicted dehydrogenase